MWNNIASRDGRYVCAGDQGGGMGRGRKGKLTRILCRRRRVRVCFGSTTRDGDLLDLPTVNLVGMMACLVFLLRVCPNNDMVPLVSFFALVLGISSRPPSLCMMYVVHTWTRPQARWMDHMTDIAGARANKAPWNIGQSRQGGGDTCMMQFDCQKVFTFATYSYGVHKQACTGIASHSISTEQTCYCSAS